MMTSTFADSKRSNWRLLLKLIPALIAASVLSAPSAQAQITAESQGGALTMWTAVGFDREIKDSKWSSATDLGYGRHSDPNNALILKREGLIVLTQDFTRRFNKHWRASISMGYWRRSYYQNDAPYDPASNPYRNEFRPYQKVYYDWDWGKVKWSNYVRTDYRFWFTPSFARWPTRFEFRLRDLIKAEIPVGKSHKNSIILMTEILAGKDKYGPERQALYHTVWSNMTWFDNRPAVFWRHNMEDKKTVFDVGVMYQRVRSTYNLNWDTSVNLMFDVIFR